MGVAFVCQKGGVSKTTTTACFAAALRKKGYSTLLVDTDAQCSLTANTGAKASGVNTLADVFNGEPVASAIQHTPQYGDVIACNKSFTGLDAKLSASDVKAVVAQLDALKEYDYVLIDTPPAVSVLTYGVAASCDKIIVPLGADISSYQALRDLHANFSAANIANKVAGVLITRWQKTILSRDILNSIRGFCSCAGWRVFDSIVSEGVTCKEIAAVQQSIFDYAPSSKQALQYAAAVDEFLAEEAL